MKTNAEKTVFHLQVARALRSISQGIAVVDMALYLKELNWSGEAIGGVLTLAGIVGAALILFVGIMSDRFGRKPFLLVYEAITALAALALILTNNPLALTIVIVLTGFGRGQNGAAGPFMPAEQAWMAVCVPLFQRGRVFSTNNALGFFGLAAGSLLAGINFLWSKALPGAASFHPLFFLIFLVSIACVITIASAPSEKGLPVNFSRPGGQAQDPQSFPKAESGAGSPASAARHSLKAEEQAIRRRENRDIAKLAMVNMFNGLGLGFVGPMMSYWFAAKFGVTSSEIGVTLSLSFIVTGGSSLLTGFLSQRFGMVKSVVWLQLISVVMILILPLMPSFWLASLFYIARSAFARGTQGARSALSSSLTRDQRRGFSVSMNSLAVRLASALGPTLSGYMLDMDIFSVPFFIAGSLQLVSTLLYGKLFRKFDLPPQEKHGLPT